MTMSDSVIVHLGDQESLAKRQKEKNREEKKKRKKKIWARAKRTLSCCVDSVIEAGHSGVWFHFAWHRDARHQTQVMVFSSSLSRGRDRSRLKSHSRGNNALTAVSCCLMTHAAPHLKD